MASIAAKYRVQHPYYALDVTPEDIEEGFTLPEGILDTAADALVAAVATITATPHTSPTMQARRIKNKGWGGGTCANVKKKNEKEQEESHLKKRVCEMYCVYWRVRVPFKITVGVTVTVGARVGVRVRVRYMAGNHLACFSRTT